MALAKGNGGVAGVFNRAEAVVLVNGNFHNARASNVAALQAAIHNPQRDAADGGFLDRVAASEGHFELLCEGDLKHVLSPFCGGPMALC